MKHLKEFKIFESVDQEPYILKNIKLGGKSTVVLRISEETYNKIKNLFDSSGNGIIDGKSIVRCDSYKWTLNIGKNYHSDKNQFPYVIWGRSGDSSFGDAPNYLPKKTFGNVKVASKLFDEFINNNLLFSNLFQKLNKGGI